MNNFLLPSLTPPFFQVVSDLQVVVWDLKPCLASFFYLVMSGKVTKRPAFTAALKQSAPTVSIQRIGTWPQPTSSKPWTTPQKSPPPPTHRTTAPGSHGNTAFSSWTRLEWPFLKKCRIFHHNYCMFASEVHFLFKYSDCCEWLSTRYCYHVKTLSICHQWGPLEDTVITRDDQSRQLMFKSYAFIYAGKVPHLQNRVTHMPELFFLA